MGMQYLKSAALGIVVATAGIVLWRLAVLSPDKQAAARRPELADNSWEAGQQRPATPLAVRPAPSPVAPEDPVERNTIRERFAQSTAYLEFVESVLPAAEGGDPDSQFYLYSALQFCDQEYRAYFHKRDGGWRAMDEALVRIAVRPEERTSVVEHVYAKCHTLIRGDRQKYGDAQQWLERATAGGQPVAMAKTARNQLLQSASGGVETQGKQTDPTTNPRDLLAAALRSKDPAVLWQIGELQALLHGDSAESTKAQWAWWLAACQRGYECGENSAWYAFSCRFDQMCLPGQTGIDHMRRTLQSDFPEVENLAKSINAKIDAGAWSELDMGS